jgi:16S rRNA (guanine(527)-N(7))-methyltransferase RsmG
MFPVKLRHPRVPRDVPRETLPGLARYDLTTMEPVSVVAAILERLGLPVNLLSPLAAHADAVARHSPRLGLVSTGDEKALLERHTADSLVFALARAPKTGEAWVDVGSGAGFPGLVLAACYPDTKFTLVESNAKKSGFLELEALDLGLANVVVHPGRAERLGASFDVAIARAVADPAVAFSLLTRLIASGGICIVAGTGAAPSGSRRLTFELPFVDSPATVFMMAEADGEAT